MWTKQHRGKCFKQKISEAGGYLKNRHGLKSFLFMTATSAVTLISTHVLAETGMGCIQVKADAIINRVARTMFGVNLEDLRACS